MNQLERIAIKLGPYPIEKEEHEVIYCPPCLQDIWGYDFFVKYRTWLDLNGRVNILEIESENEGIIENVGFQQSLGPFKQTDNVFDYYITHSQTSFDPEVNRKYGAHPPVAFFISPKYRHSTREFTGISFALLSISMAISQSISYQMAGKPVDNVFIYSSLSPDIKNTLKKYGFDIRKNKREEDAIYVKREFQPLDIRRL